MKCERIALNETAYFDTYFLHNSQEYNVNKKRPLVLICPGGGYAFTSDREAEPIALKFNSIGCHCVVLWYTVMDQVKNVPMNAFLEGAQTIQYIREHCEENCIDENTIIVCGFSAGGHLACQLALRSQEDWVCEKLQTTADKLKVNLAILGYPGVYFQASKKDDLGFASSLIAQPNTMNERIFGKKEPTKEDIEANNLLHYVTENAPPMFIWHTGEDVLVDVEHSLKLGLCLREHQVPIEMHIFEKGEHGLALCDRTTARKASHHNHHVVHWFALCEEWLSDYIDKKE